MLLLCPLPYVPILFAAAGVLGLIPDFRKGSWIEGSLAEAYRGLVGVPSAAS